ncbi:MAG: hypothetical protein AB7P76_06675 [Candidatus Melainabacteria bacterium]
MSTPVLLYAGSHHGSPRRPRARRHLGAGLVALGSAAAALGVGSTLAQGGSFHVEALPVTTPALCLSDCPAAAPVRVPNDLGRETWLLGLGLGTMAAGGWLRDEEAWMKRHPA